MKIKYLKYLKFYQMMIDDYDKLLILIVQFYFLVQHKYQEHNDMIMDQVILQVSLKQVLVKQYDLILFHD